MAEPTPVGLLDGVGAGVGVSALPYPSGGLEVVSVDQATALAGTGTEGAVPHPVNVMVFTLPSLKDMKMEAGRSELGEMSTRTVALGEYSEAATVPVILVSVAPAAPVTCSVEVATKPVIPNSDATVMPACSAWYGPSAGWTETQCPAIAGAV